MIYGNIGVRGDKVSQYDVTYFTNDEINGEIEVDPIDVGSFGWDTFTWDLFTWGVIGPLTSWALRPALKNIQYFAVEFSNSQGGISMNIQSIKWTYKLGKLIK